MLQREQFNSINLGKNKKKEPQNLNINIFHLVIIICALMRSCSLFVMDFIIFPLDDSYSLEEGRKISLEMRPRG